jgi:hypothetical protein
VITINLHHTKDCPPGRYITQFRCSKADKEFMTSAAAMLGMPFAVFIRTVAFQAACQIHGADQGNYGQDARLPDRSA